VQRVGRGEEDAVVFGRQGVAAGILVACGGDLEEARSGLLLEPLPAVAFGDAGAARELPRLERAGLGEHGVQAETATELDAQQFDSAEHRPEESLGERLGDVD
jgi:hypothetical protein